MFKVYNPETEKIEVVAKIDYKKHWHCSKKPFSGVIIDEVVETTPEVIETPTIEEETEVTEKVTPKKR